MTTPLNSPPSPSTSSVAVIGLACRLPGGIDSPQRFWQALLRGADFIDEVPADRWDADTYYGPESGVPGRSVSRWGAFLDTVGAFDAGFFGMTEPEAIAIDPQHRLLLETSWEAVEHAGLDPSTLARSQTGVFVGLTHSDYEVLSAEHGAPEGPYGFTGTSSSLASARVSQALGLHGPALTVDTACSSGLMAVHQACLSLQVGESDLALAGGVSVILEPHRSVAGSQQGLLSPTGRCRSFDADADGYVAGEGCVVLLLKRLPEAIRDQNRILAVLRGSAANHDGSAGLGAERSEQAQIAVYRSALAAAGVEPATVGLVEAHGLGNPDADRAEYKGLAAVYGADAPCFLGSVKANFGHCQAASGPLGLLKAILAVDRGTVPEHLNFARLPDQLARVQTNLVVPQENSPWPAPADHPRRAAVSAHGLSGTNVHIVVEQSPVPALPDSPPASPQDPQPALLFPISATSAQQLRQTSARLADWIDEHGTALTGADLADLGYTLARGRAHRPIRTAVAASNFGELGQALRHIAENDLPYQPAVGPDGHGPVWVFAEHIARWTGLAELLIADPAFAAAIAAMEPLVAEESGFSLTEAISVEAPPAEVERLHLTSFAIQVGLAEAMKAYGVTPGAVIGHSLGEVAAAVVAGGLTLRDGIRVTARRSRLLSRIAGSGAMATVELPAQQVLSEFSIRDVSGAVLAVVESPVSTTIGGDAEAVRDLVTAWQQQGVAAYEVAATAAAHSPQVEPILEDLARDLSDLQPSPPEIPYFSATLWAPRDRPAFDGAYWAENLRYTARFAAAVQAAIKDGFRVFGELAPRSDLAAAIEQNAVGLDTQIAALAAAPSEPEAHAWTGLRGFVADLHSVGTAIDFAAHYPSGRLVEAPLPSWDHRQLLLSRESADAAPRGAAVQAVHPLLGAHVHLLEEPERHVWQGDAGTVAHPWLADHRIHNTATLPAAAYGEMALVAARMSLGESAEVRDLRFSQPLLLDEQTPVSSGAVVGVPGVLDFAVTTHQDRERLSCATAVLHAAADVGQPAARDITAVLAAHPARIDDAELHAAAGAHGIHQGPAFAGVTAIRYGSAQHIVGATALAEITLPGPLRAQQALYDIHPALLEACIRSVALRPDAPRGADGAGLQPVSVRRLRRYALIRDARYCLSTVTATGADAYEADLELLDASGEVLLRAEGLRFVAGGTEREAAERTLDERLLTIEWQRREAPDAGAAGSGRWLLLNMADAADPLATGLATALAGAHGESDVVAFPQHREAQPADALHGALEGRNGVVVITPAAEGGSSSPQRGRDVVAGLLQLVRQMATLPGEAPRLYVVTRGAAAVQPPDRINLEQAGLRGLMRVIDSEHPHLKITGIDLDSDTAGQDLAQVAAQVRSGSEEEETAWRAGAWYTARLRPGPFGPADRRTTVVEHGRDGVCLHWGHSSANATWELVTLPRTAPAAGQIEVAVTATGAIPDALANVGGLADFAGVVTAVGAEVTGHQVGDHVAGISAEGRLGTFVTCDARLTATLPAQVPLAEAAALPNAYATAWLALHDLARIAPTDTVLIHRATDGVGQAALAVARAAGCAIFATDDTPQRRQRLRDMGVEHVYDCCTADFADRIQQDTGGRGVDVVLNCLSGPARRAGIDVLGHGGRFVELSAGDVDEVSWLSLLPFRRNLSLHVVDVAALAHSHPHTVQRLLTTVYQQVAQGLLPMPPTFHQPLLGIAGDREHSAESDCAATAVIDAPQSGESIAVIPPEQAQPYRADGAYIITGATAGPGLYLAAEMAAAGCGRLVLNGPAAPDNDALQVIERLRAAGNDVELVYGDIADPETASRLVEVATATGLPVRGVLHAVSAIAQAPLVEVTDDLIDRCWAPKVDGAVNLHRALREGVAAQPVDWFCVFSSTAALIGSPGHGATAAADSWLDAFGHWRRRQGLSATVIGWGPWARPAGATDRGAEDRTAISYAEGARALDAVLRYGRTYSGYAPVSGAPWLTALAHRSRFAEAFKAVRQGSPDAERFLAELRQAPRDEWLGAIVRLVSDQMSLLLRRTVDPDRPLPEYGLDSLASLEFRTRIETETGVRAGPAQLTTVRGLSRYVCDQLVARVEQQEPVDVG